MDHMPWCACWRPAAAMRGANGRQCLTFDRRQGRRKKIAWTGGGTVKSGPFLDEQEGN
jgi:hypothetical protein